ncbi:MAG TPA: hypothetical protein VLD38_03990 [Nitrosopumilaceae archaeon]|nr:hypothetical protein [Nitrosopumilaceae archaeon]
MRDDERFEIERALDLIPHVIGSSWATTWFRLNKIRKPTREEYRNKVVEYVKFLENLIDSFPKSDNFQEITLFSKKRYREEIEKILVGNNLEIEKRIDRYLNYG